jgi:hypothetical protein
MSTLKTSNIQHPSASSPSIELDSDGGINFFFSAEPQDGQVLAYNATDGKWEAKDMNMKEKRIAAFTGSGTWTVPAGVTYAIAHMLGGGGGGGGTAPGDGGASSVAFSSGTVSSNGGVRFRNTADNAAWTFAALANTGRGASLNNSNGDNGSAAGDSTYIVAGAAVTPAASITVTVGAGGAAGTNGKAGGSGYVYIEYYEEV